MAYFHDIAVIGGRFNAYGREEELGPGNIMGWAVSNTTLIGGLESVMEGVIGVQNTDSEVVGARNGNN